MYIYICVYIYILFFRMYSVNIVNHLIRSPATCQCYPTVNADGFPNP